jgi:hypothetical protein
MRDREGARKPRVGVIGPQQLLVDNQVFLIFYITQYVIAEMSLCYEGSERLAQVPVVQHMIEASKVGKG